MLKKILGMLKRVFRGASTQIAPIPESKSNCAAKYRERYYYIIDYIMDNNFKELITELQFVKDINIVSYKIATMIISKIEEDKVTLDYLSIHFFEQLAYSLRNIDISNPLYNDDVEDFLYEVLRQCPQESLSKIYYKTMNSCNQQSVCTTEKDDLSSRVAEFIDKHSVKTTGASLVDIKKQTLEENCHEYFNKNDSIKSESRNQEEIDDFLEAFK